MRNRISLALCCWYATVAAPLAQAVSPGIDPLFRNGFEIEAQCADMLDNDGDGLADCADPDCAATLLWSRPSSNPLGQPESIANTLVLFEHPGAQLRLVSLREIDGQFQSSLDTDASGTSEEISALSAGPALFQVTFGSFLRRTSASALTPWVSRSVRRLGCASDGLVAKPVVQTLADSDASFQSAIGVDLVMVGTARGCGDTTGNQVIALNAADILATPKWIFNVGEYEVDQINACMIDAASNTVFCATRHGPGTFQGDVWALDTTTGTPRWSAPLGASVRSAPALSRGGHNHLYVLSDDLVMHALNATSGVEDWSVVLTPAGAATRLESDLTVGISPPLLDAVYFIDTQGKVRQVIDTGSSAGSGLPGWSSAATGYLGAPLVSSSLYERQILVGQNNGMLVALDAITGAVARSYPVAPGAPIANAPVFATLDRVSASMGERVVASGNVTSGAQSIALCTPLRPL